MEWHDGEVWDEYMWEAHIDRMEKKRKEFQKFFEAKGKNGLPQWQTLLDESYDEFDAVDAFIEAELENEDFLFDDGYEDDWDDEWIDENWLDEEDDFFLDPYEEDGYWNEDFIDDFDEGEQWKELSDEFTRDENGSIENFELYKRGHALAVHTLSWTENVHSKNKNDALSDFVSNILIVSAKLAGGYSFGFEKDFIGGNIACTKKALYAANKALSILGSDLKTEAFMTRFDYRYFHRLLFELRNDTGIYVQELRERFDLGLE